MEIFDNFNPVLIGQYMFVEFIIGVVVGTIFKFIAKFNANRADNFQVFPATDYSSIQFGENFPRAEFDPLKLPPEFVIVQYDSDTVICEDFFTFLGSSLKVEYQNGQYLEAGQSALSSPVYLFTVVVPAILGFYSMFFPFVSQVGSLLLVSGLAWMFITFWIPMIWGILQLSFKE